MNIHPLDEKFNKAFEKLFCDYYTEIDCEDDPLPLSREAIEDCKAGLLSVAVAEEDGEALGFIIYQIDDIINDWCFFEGAGDIRELYIAPQFRRRGVATELVLFAESELKRQGAATVYTLPTEESEKFFEKVGYFDGGDYCPELDNKVYTKNIDKTDIL